MVSDTGVPETAPQRDPGVVRAMRREHRAKVCEKRERGFPEERGMSVGVRASRARDQLFWIEQ